MATSVEIVTLSSTGEADGSFSVSGVFWLVAPTNNVVPLPQFQSAVAGISAADLAVLRSGIAVEQSFSTTPFSPSTTQATVDTAIQALFTTAQTALNSANPALSTAVLRAFNGSTWAAFAGVVGAVQPGARPQIVAEFLIAVSLGMVPNVVQGRATGYVANATAAVQKIRATAYSPASPGVAAQRSVSSSSASDAPAGTGALTVTINYLDTSFAQHAETVTLNGTTTVNTVGTNIAYIESMVVATTGSNLANVGIISLFNATAGGGGTLGSIAANDNQTFWAHHYVPTGKTCLVTNASFGGNLIGGVGTMNHTGTPASTNLPTIGIGGQYPHITGAIEDHIFACPLAILGPDLIVLSEKPNTATASNQAYGTFEYIQY